MATALITPNGKTPAGEPIVAERPRPAFAYENLRDLRGADYVRGWECTQLLQIVTMALNQASSCAGNAELAPSEVEVRDLMVEALKCVSTAEHYARMLLDQLEVRDPRLGNEPPW